MFNKDKANDVIEFIKCLHHTGDFFGQEFNLQKWQAEALSEVYGSVNELGRRVTRYAYWEIPKKNGKTEIAAAIAIYHLFNDPPGGQIYCCAADREQAGLVYKAAKQMIEQDESLTEVLVITDSNKTIRNSETDTYLKVLSAEAYTKHGINPTVVIFDELHAQPNRDLWDVMTFGAGAARKEPLWWVITTAGDDPDKKSIGWEVHDKAERIKNGTLIDESWHVRIFGAPTDANIFDESVWFDANPNLGVSIDVENVRLEAKEAKDSAAREKLFRWLRLNQWVAVKRLGWLPLPLWDKTIGDWKEAELKGLYCYVGLDLSSTTDLTAIAVVFPPQKGLDDWRVIFRTFVPAESMKERVNRDKVPYDDWIDDGYLISTEGNAVDYARVQNEIENINAMYKVRYLCVDKWNSTMMTQNLQRKGIKSIEIEQTITGMSPGMKKIEQLMLKGELTHEDNPAARWCFGNVVVATDGNENIKPMKNKSFERIERHSSCVD